MGAGAAGGNCTDSSRPSLFAFHTLLEIHARSLLPLAPQRAEEVVQTMQAAGVSPDPRTYALLARAYMRSPSGSGLSAAAAVDAVYERCLSDGLSPDPSLLRSLFAAYARQGLLETPRMNGTFYDSTARVEKLLRDHCIPTPTPTPSSSDSEMGEVVPLHPSTYALVASIWESASQPSAPENESPWLGPVPAARLLLQESKQRGLYGRQLYVRRPVEGARLHHQMGVDVIHRLEGTFLFMMTFLYLYVKSSV